MTSRWIKYANSTCLHDQQMREFRATYARYKETRQQCYLDTCFKLVYDIGYQKALDTVKENTLHGNQPQIKEGI